MWIFNYSHINLNTYSHQSLMMQIPSDIITPDKIIESYFLVISSFHNTKAVINSIENVDLLYFLSNFILRRMRHHSAQSTIRMREIPQITPKTTAMGNETDTQRRLEVSGRSRSRSCCRARDGRRGHRNRSYRHSRNDRHRSRSRRDRGHSRSRNHDVRDVVLPRWRGAQ